MANTLFHRIVKTFSLAIAVVLGFDIPPLYSEATKSEVALYVPAFTSADALGLNVSTILHLQIWKSLRMGEPGHPKLSFGSGMIYYGMQGSEISSPDEAKRYMRQVAKSDKPVDGVLWGKTWRLKDGVVVQGYLSLNQGPLGLAFYGRPYIWNVEVNIKGRPYSFDATIPSFFYEFAPVILKEAVVNSYSSPQALRMYRSKDWKEELGPLGADFSAREVGKEWALVKSNNKEGYIRLPMLSENASEIVDYVGGIIRCFRRDWRGAIALLEKAFRQPEMSTSVRIDTLLYIALSKEHLGQNPQHELDEAYKLNPYNKSTVVYTVMHLLGAIQKTKLPAEQTLLIQQIQDLLKEHGSVFPPYDPWLIKVRHFLSS